jgi:hypothetical protein
MSTVLGLLITLGIIISVLVASYAGFLLVLNPINSENRSMAKKVLMNAAIGLLITICAWLLVNTFLTVLGYANGIQGATAALLGGGNNCLPIVTQGKVAGGGTDQTTQTEGSGGVNGGTCPSGQTCGANGTCGPAQPKCGDATCTAGQVCSTDGKSCVDPQSCTVGGQGLTGGGSIDYSAVQDQLAAVSGPLSALLQCMGNKLPPGVGRVSALTDHYSNTDKAKIAHCDAVGHAGDSQCAHTKGSCHYGGSCAGQAYAVDFGDEEHGSTLNDAAKACNGGAWYHFEGDHVHISVGRASGCNCDGGG